MIHPSISLLFICDIIYKKGYNFCTHQKKLTENLKPHQLSLAVNRVQNTFHVLLHLVCSNVK